MNVERLPEYSAAAQNTEKPSLLNIFYSSQILTFSLINKFNNVNKNLKLKD